MRAFLIFSILLTVQTSCAQIPFNTKRETSWDLINEMAKDYVGAGTIAETGDKKFPTIVLGLITPKINEIYSFDTNSKKSADASTDIFPLSSISKMLTGLILARGVHEGAFALQTPISRLLKNDLNQKVGTSRTLGMMVSHYASYKAKPQNLDWTNPYAPAANYTRQQLATCLGDSACSSLVDSPGTKFLYSDLGIGLLGLSLVDHYNEGSYEELLKNKLLTDFRMKNTSTKKEHFNNKVRFVGGFTQNDQAVAPATMGTLVAAGGVLSSGHDMQILLGELVHPSSSWAKIIDRATAPIKRIGPGRSIAYAIDINDVNSMHLFSKSGEQAGYSSIIMWNKETKSGVFMLANRGMASKSLAKFSIRIHQAIVDGLLY